MNRDTRNIQSAFGRLNRLDGAPLAGPAPGSPAEIRLEQQEHLDYWAAFWRGLVEEHRWRDDNRAGRRRPIYQLYTVPKRRSWTPDDQGRDPSRPRMLQLGQRRPRLVRYHVIQSIQNPERLRRADGEIIRGENPVMTPLRPLGFRFKKTLGQGGGGIAMLVDLVDENGRADEWVIKAPVGRGSLSREARNMRLMSGARHMVQRKYINVPDPDVPGNQVALNTDRPDCVIGMELLKHGSLDSLIRKISARNLKLRDDELWMIFHCLFRSCVAMSRPGTWSSGLNPERDPIPLQDEDLPQYGETASSMIHFDIDPDNILIGDYESDPGSHTHETIPIFKISDLGVAVRFNELNRMGNDTIAMLGSRRWGKVENHTPEQFTKEWDYLAGPPSATNERVAGNYYWKNNLYAVGNVMWMLMTRCCTAMPPKPTEFTMQTNDTNTIDGYTYGYDLFDGNNEDYHVTLRSFVVWCMMHDPDQRPNFEELEHMILGNVGIFQQGGDQNTEGRTSIRDILTTPPPPPSPAPIPARPSGSRGPTASTLARIAAGEDPGAWILGLNPASNAAVQHVRWTSSGWQGFDAGIAGGGGPNQPAVPGPRRSDFRTAARNVFRTGPGGGLRNLAQRAGRGIRRVVRGAVRRVTGSGGPHRQSQLGSATLSRRADQQADGGRSTMVNLQFAMAAMGVVVPGNIAVARRRQATGDNQGANPGAPAP